MQSDLAKKDNRPPWPTRYIAARCEVPRDAIPRLGRRFHAHLTAGLRLWLHHGPRTLVLTNIPQGVHPSSNPVIRGLSGLVLVGWVIPYDLVDDTICPLG